MAKILFVLEYFPPHIGGVETLFDNLTKRLAERGYEIEICTILVPGSKPFEESLGRKIYRFSVSSRHGFSLKFFEIAKHAKDADLIHTTSFVAAGATLLSNIFARKPVLLTVHEIWGGLFFEFQPFWKALPNYVLEKMMCLFYRNSKITCPSEYTKKSLRKNMINAQVILHGINHEIFNAKIKSKKRKHPTYLFFGRPGISKGLPYLLKAVSKVREEIPEAKLALMVSKSDKEDFSSMMKIIKKLDLEKNILFISPKRHSEDVSKVIKSCDLVIVPSLTEGFCFSAVEAQACGTPVVASNAGSLPEVVKGGVLVEPRNSERLAEAIVDLLKNPSKRKRLGKIGEKFSRKFTWENSIESYEKIYEKMLNR